MGYDAQPPAGEAPSVSQSAAGGWPHPPTVVPATGGPAGVPGAVAWPEAVIEPAAPTRIVDAGRFWAGIGSTALVAALAGVVGVLLFERVGQLAVVLRPDLVSSDAANAALLGVSVALIGGVIAFVLAKAAPRPGIFFGWIMALILAAGALSPLGWTPDLAQAIATGVVNAVIATAVWSLVSLTLSRTVRLANAR